MMHHARLLLAAGFLAAVGSAADATVESSEVEVPAAVPSNASPKIDLSFPGFAFEEASFYLYAADEKGQPNTFSQNLINDVLKRTGGAPILRVGGTSGDHGHYNSTQTEPVIPDGKRNPPQGSQISVGKKFFTGFANFPGCQFIFMVPLALRDLNNTIEWTRQGLNNVPKGALYAIDIGNEPSAYSWFKDTQGYVTEYLKFEKALINEFPSLGTSPSFQALDAASGNIAATSIKAALDAGINKNGQIRSFAYHYYEGKDDPGQTLAQLQSRVVNHTVVKNHVAKYKDDVDYLHAHLPGVSYNMDEDGNTLGQGDMQQRNQLATALWNLDFQLQCMTIGVNRVNMQQIFYPGYSMWQPQGGGLVPAGVHANYYSQPMIGDFIGSTNNTRVVELKLPSKIPADTHSAYAAYDGNQLARMAILNMRLWTQGSGDRPSATFTLSGLRDGTVTAQYLTAPEGAYANKTLTYAGQQWQYPSGKPTQVKHNSRQLQVTNGKLNITIDATSAILLTWG